jgi:large-conductance mechanosensitive channel
MSIGLIIATQVNKITTIIMELLFNPIINRLSFGQTKILKDLELDLFGMNFKIGIILENIINLFIVLIIIYYIWKLTKNTGKEKY